MTVYSVTRLHYIKTLKYIYIPYKIIFEALSVDSAWCRSIVHFVIGVCIYFFVHKLELIQVNPMCLNKYNENNNIKTVQQI